MAEISFNRRVVIVTGAGGGIGREHALEFARRGASVVVNDLGGDVGGRGGSASMAQAVVDEIRATGGTAVANHDSVATSEGCNGIVAQAMAEFGRLDALVNNAGIMRNVSIEDCTDEDWDAVVATHLTGSFRLTRAAWPHMKAQGYGRIVYTASSAGLFGNPFVGAYGAAKAGILGLMNTAALEGSPHGILANAIMPNALSRMAMQAAADWADRIEGMSEEMPPEIGNSMNPEFNTPLAVFLASEACSETQGLFSQCLGRFARVVLGTVPGWQAQRQNAPSADEVAAHWGEIAATPAGIAVPKSATEEHGIVLAQSGAFA